MAYSRVLPNVDARPEREVLSFVIHGIDRALGIGRGGVIDAAGVSFRGRGGDGARSAC